MTAIDLFTDAEIEKLKYLLEQHHKDLLRQLSRLWMDVEPSVIKSMDYKTKRLIEDLLKAKYSDDAVVKSYITRLDDWLRRRKTELGVLGPFRE